MPAAVCRLALCEQALVNQESAAGGKSSETNWDRQLYAAGCEANNTKRNARPDGRAFIARYRQGARLERGEGRSSLSKMVMQDL